MHYPVLQPVAARIGRRLDDPTHDFRHSQLNIAGEECLPSTPVSSAVANWMLRHSVAAPSAHGRFSWT